MSLLPNPRPDELLGDASRRRARFGLLLLSVGTVISVAAFSGLAQIWPPIEALEGIPFMVAATLLGAVLAGAPVLAFLGLVLAVWCGVESVYQARRHPTPGIDRLIVGLGIAVWFAPTLGLLVAVGQAVLTGSIHFSRPPRDYLLSTDPIAFWQGVGFWLIAASGFAYLAWRYWRGKLSGHSLP